MNLVSLIIQNKLSKKNLKIILKKNNLERFLKYLKKEQSRVQSKIFAPFFSLNYTQMNLHSRNVAHCPGCCKVKRTNTIGQGAVKSVVV